MLLCWQTETVVAKRVQNVVALHAVEARIHVGADVAKGVANVQASTRWVGEHVEHEELLAPRHFGRVGKWAGGVRGLVGAVGIPFVLPARLNIGS